jgi:hypothetical protein
LVVGLHTHTPHHLYRSLARTTPHARHRQSAARRRVVVVVVVAAADALAAVVRVSGGEIPRLSDSGTVLVKQSLVRAVERLRLEVHAQDRLVRGLGRLEHEHTAVAVLGTGEAETGRGRQRRKGGTGAVKK